MPEQSETHTFSKRRIRMNHKWTAKDGWRLDETCVDIEFGAFVNGAEIERQLVHLNEHAFKIGKLEADVRNQDVHHDEME